MFHRRFIGSFFNSDTKLVVADAFMTKINVLRYSIPYIEPLIVNVKQNCAYDVYLVYEMSQDGKSSYIDYLVCIPSDSNEFGDIRNYGLVNMSEAMTLCVCSKNRYGRAGGSLNTIEKGAAYSVYDLLTCGVYDLMPKRAYLSLGPISNELIHNSKLSLVTGVDLLAACNDDPTGFFLNQDKIRSSHFSENCMNIADSSISAGMIYRGCTCETFNSQVPVFCSENTIIASLDGANYSDFCNSLKEIEKLFK